MQEEVNRARVEGAVIPEAQDPVRWGEGLSPSALLG